MPASRKEVESQENKLSYLDSKADALSQGRCERCFCYYPNDDLFCHSTEIPNWACHVGKKAKVVSDKPAKGKSKVGSEEEQLMLELE